MILKPSTVLAILALAPPLAVAIPNANATGSAPPAGATRLTLVVTGEARHLPDTLIARLSAQATTPSSAAAQRAINRMTAQAIAAAHAIPGLRVTTSGYAVYPTDAKRTAWHAAQGIVLRFAASPAAPATAPVRRLIGQFQAAGMTLDSIAGGLSTKAVRETRARAIGDAVTQLRSESNAVAVALGEQAGPILKIQLDVQAPFRPVIMAMRAAGSAAPQAQPGPITERVTLSGTILLESKSP